MPVNFSWAMFSLFAWLVPHVSIEVGQYRRSLSFWLGVNFREGKRVVSKHALIAIVSALLVIIGTAIGVALTTKELDPNMINIIEGMSLFLAAVVTLILSLKSPKWIGVYYSRKRAAPQPLFQCTKVLAFNVRWSIWRLFCRVYFSLLPFYCSANAAKITVSMIAGLAFGFLMDYIIYLGRRKRETSPSIMWAMGMAFFLVIWSCALFQKGTRFIDTVWGRNEWKGSKNVLLGVISAILWFFMSLFVHCYLWLRTKRMVEEVGLGNGVLKGYLAPAHTRKGERLATSLFKEMLVSYRKRRSQESTPGKMMLKQTPALATVKEHGEEGSDGEKADDLEDANEDFGDAREDGFDTEQKEQPELFDVITDDDDELAKTADSAGLGIVAVSLNVIRSTNDSGRAKACNSTNNGTDGVNACISTNDDGGGVHLSNKTFASTPSKLSSIHEEAEEDNSEPPTACSLIGKKCCGCKQNEWKERSLTEKTIVIIEWILWVGIAAGFTFFTIINIGAQAQVASVNRWYPIAEAAIYTDMDLGAVCAINEAAFRPNSIITTFSSKEDANAAGFKVLHCGACGACSTWHNLRLEWWTRNYLAAESARCAKKSLLGGRNAVYECLMKEPIQFDAACSECWTDDIICTKNNCAFIYLQSQLINKVGKL
uniref:Uncharacterized protein n=1 Tax=Odontella aurita TaxID=265563 RepID=A0A7S4JWK0_9STRA|mmetsp:Transcript_55709/g.166922  ORF Transcript_55709/g.166922 Transcript_55709/m.166922 type:complete len:655 (+) Transcript_55709:214-2178(+)